MKMHLSTIRQNDEILECMRYATIKEKVLFLCIIRIYCSCFKYIFIVFLCIIRIYCFCFIYIFIVFSCIYVYIVFALYAFSLYFYAYTYILFSLYIHFHCIFLLIVCKWMSDKSSGWTHPTGYFHFKTPTSSADS